MLLVCVLGATTEGQRQLKKEKSFESEPNEQRKSEKELKWPLRITHIVIITIKEIYFYSYSITLLIF